MGPGFAVVEPASNEIFSPVTGIVTSIFPTKHAIGLEMSDGKEVLLHIGIDTVELQGQGFDVLAGEAAKVTPETKLAVVDRVFEGTGKSKYNYVFIPWGYWKLCNKIESRWSSRRNQVHLIK